MYPLGKSIWNFSPPLRKTSLAANQCYWIEWDCKLEVVRAHSPSWSSIACWDPEGREHVGNCAVSYEHEKLALFVLQGVPHSHHTRTHTHVTARSGGLMLFNRQGQALCSLRKVKKKKRIIRVSAFMLCCPLILLPGQSTTLGLVPHKWDLSFRRTQWWLM